MKLNCGHPYTNCFCSLKILIQKGDSRRLEHFIKIMEMDLKTAEGLALAGTAIELGKYLCLETLLRYGVSPNMGDELGETLCHLAARTGDYIALAIISGFGPDLLKTDLLQEIPIMTSFA